MAGKGWIKLHRKIRDNPIFNDHQLLRLWLICLTEATHKERDQIIGKQTVHLMPGQFVTGRFDIKELYNQGLKPKEKVTGEKTVFRWLETLESGGFLTIEKTNKYSIVTIDKWGFYQGEDTNDDQQNDQQMTNKRPSNDQQMTTNKNVKNVENEKNDKKKEYTSDFESFWNAYPRKIGKAEAFKTWKTVLKKGEDPQIIILCAENYKAQCDRMNTETQYIKHPKTFLNEERYKDYQDGGESHGGSTRVSKYQGDSGSGYGGSNRKITSLDQTSRVREYSDEELAELI